MTRQIGSVVSAVFTALLVASSIATLSDTPASAADDCIAAPKSPPPQGRHWYYRTDREKKRRCWYLGPQGLNIHRPAPQAATPVQPAAETPAPPSVERADSTFMGFPSVMQPAPPSSPTAMLGDIWNIGTDALQKPDQANPIDIVENDGTKPSDTPASVPLETGIQNTDTQDTQRDIRTDPLVTAAIQSPDPATNSPLRLLLFVAGVLAIAGFVLSLTIKLFASKQRPAFVDRHDADRSTIVAPKLASSIFDIKDVPPLAPIGHIERRADTGQLLRKLLRDLERSPGSKALAR